MATRPEKKYVSLRQPGTAPSTRTHRPLPKKEYKPLTPSSQELKPLKPARRVSEYERKGLKPLKPASQELKPLKPSSGELRPFMKNRSGSGPLYVPTHFRLRASMLPRYTGNDRKYNIQAVRDLLKSEFERILLSSHLMPKMGNEKELLLVDPLSSDFSRFYFELNDPDVVAFDYNRILEENPMIAERLRGTDDLAQPIGLDPEINIRKWITGEIGPEVGIHPYVREELSGFGVPPVWYRGFVHDSYIRYTAVNATGETARGKLRLSDSRKTIEFSIHFAPYIPGECSIAPVNKIEFAKRLERGIAPREQFQLWVEHKPYSHVLQNALVYHDLFNNVTFFGPADVGVRLLHVKIVLNNEVILDTDDADPEFRERPNWINSRTGFDLTGLILRYKYMQLSDDSRVRSNEILKICARELGHAWSIKYGAPWGYEWCYDFSSWVLDKSGISNVPRPEIPLHPDYQKGLTDLRKWFILSGRYINGDPNINNRYRHGPVPFQRLNTVIKPGFLVEVDNAFHGVFFIEWISPLSYLSHKKYRLINGNSDFRVKFGSRWVKNYQAHGGVAVPGSARPRNDDFYWQGNSSNPPEFVEVPDPLNPGDTTRLYYTVYDGFGDTEGPITVSIKPRAKSVKMSVIDKFD